MRVEQVELDATLASNLLARNSGNRPVSKRTFERYAQDIIDGRWLFTAEPVKVDSAGRLVDGQHRCLALLMAEELKPGSSITVLLAHGIDPKAQDVMDTGRKRSIGDQLARRGVTQYMQMGATLRLLVTRRMGNNSATPSQSEMIEFYESNKVELTLANEATPYQYQNTSGIPESVLVAARYLIVEASEDMDAVEEFFHAVASGENLGHGHPALALRARVQKARLQRERIANYAMLAMVLRAWNAWRAGESMQRIPLRTRGKAVNADAISE